ncbi:MAG: hypothetical protein QW220_00605 [Candidatus Bathyarchaeia archaeon]
MEITSGGNLNPEEVQSGRWWFLCAWGFWLFREDDQPLLDKLLYEGASIRSIELRKELLESLRYLKSFLAKLYDPLRRGV